MKSDVYAYVQLEISWRLYQQAILDKDQEAANSHFEDIIHFNRRLCNESEQSDC